MVPRDQPPRAWGPQNPSWHQVGSPGQHGGAGEAKVAQTDAHHSAARGSHEEKDQCCGLQGVLCTDTKRTERYFRRGHQSSFVSRNAEEEEVKMHFTLSEGWGLIFQLNYYIIPHTIIVLTF